ncbi:Hypothetical protein PBC10988_27600 [Planctomycetales bacterium 10988]|nr:Hypothetical protein PBC10988_27600 [Planctomycetales bacterium 10988]
MSEIQFAELNGSGLVQVSPRGMRGTRLFHVFDYGEASAFVESLLGVTFTEEEVITRSSPAPFADGSPLYCTNARIEGLGQVEQDISGGPSYLGGAKVTANYETLTYDPDTESPSNPELGPYVSESLSIGGRSVALPREGFHWSDGRPLSSSDRLPGKLLPQADYRLTRHKVPELPKALLFSMIGKVNANNFSDAAAETLLFLGADATRDHAGNGSEAWQIELHFRYEPLGHNNVFRSETGAFELVKTQVGDHKLYPTADFTTLLPEASS